MTMPKPSSHEPSVPESFDFEITDFEQARHALEELPPGVGQVPQATGYWDQKRRKPLPTDRALSGAAMEWLVHLPPDLKPRNLAEKYPRVVNTLAEFWFDPAHRVEMLDSLLDDKRGGRRGFSLEVQAELRNLRKHAG